jgi:large subunit ribosomal protein L24
MQKTRSSKDPRKQRKFFHNAPAHIRHKLMGANVSSELAASKGAKTIPLRKGDTVRIMRGDHKGFEGKVSRLDMKNFRVYLEGLTREKVDGTTIFLPIHPSKVQIRNLNLDDKWRKAILERKVEINKAAEKTAKPAVKKKAEKPTVEKAVKPKPEAPAPIETKEETVAKEEKPEVKEEVPIVKEKKAAKAKAVEEKPLEIVVAPEVAPKAETKPKTAKPKAPRKAAAEKKKETEVVEAEKTVEKAAAPAKEAKPRAAKKPAAKKATKAPASTKAPAKAPNKRKTPPKTEGGT